MQAAWDSLIGAEEHGIASVTYTGDTHVEVSQVMASLYLSKSRNQIEPGAP